VNYEAKMWERLRDIIRPVGEATRVESGQLITGIPDVHYAINGKSGWIENKSVTLPRSHDTILTIRSLTETQKRWHRRWSKHTTTFLYIELRDYFHMFIPGRVVDQVGKLTFAQLLSEAALVNEHKLDPKTVRQLLNTGFTPARH
jgi:hypothetical protein